MAKDKVAAEPESLMAVAFRLLKENDPEKALKIARRLEKMRYSGAFEIQALAYDDLDRKQKAIEVLEKGTRTVPDVWLLWQLLGNYRSDLGHYAKANEAYEAGLVLEGADRLSLSSNYALALVRQGEIDRAEEIAVRMLNDEGFDQADPGAKFLLHGTYIEVLHNKARDDELIAYVRRLPLQDADEDSAVYVAGIMALCAHALWRKGQDDEAKTELARAITKDKHSEKVQWAFREIYGGQGDDELNHYRLLIHGTWSEPFEAGEPLPGFYTTYEVVAEDENEAMDFVRAFEPESVRESLAIEESEVLRRYATHKGVYMTSGYGFFPGE